MKVFINFLSLPLMLIIISCSDEMGGNNNNEICDAPIGTELLTYTYYNDNEPTLTSTPIEERGNISYGDAIAIPVNNGVDIVIPGVRIRTAEDNYEILSFNIDEAESNNDCFINQSEFTLQQSSFQTDIASVLVLDMSTSLLDNITELKSYAKNFANTVVNSSDNSTVAVVFFSDRDAIVTTQFYTSLNIGELNTLIDDFTNFQERTALYQAAKEGIELLESLSFVGERNLVVFTDGGDNDSNNPSELVNEIVASDINKFAIGLKGDDFIEENLESIVTQGSNFVIADDIVALEDIFKFVGRGVISVYELRYNRSDQLLKQTESKDIRFSIESAPIE